MTDLQAPLVSIGLPVFNGVPHLEKALRTLLAQDYANFELIVSDNASTDDTAALCQSLSAGRPEVRYHRNAENIGALGNFLLVLAKARGEYFMWAAHDDYWNAQFVSALVARLESDPSAVLATPAAIHVNEDGTLRSDPPDRPAPGKTPLGNLKVVLNDHAASWFYGIFRTEWLRAHLKDMNEYPAWGNDMLWLAEVSLRYQLVGSQDALMFKRLRRSGFAPKTSRAVLWFWMYIFYYYTRNCLRYTNNWRERARALAICWRYVYCIGMRRSNILRTAWRVVRIALLSALSLIPLAAKVAWQRAAKPRVSSPPLPAESVPATVKKTATKKAA